MQFYEPQYFLGLWVLPAVFLLFILSRKIWHARMRKFGDVITIKNKLIPEHRGSYWRQRTVAVMLIFLFSVLALARPQWGEEKKKVERKGIDIMFLLDTSLSMLAEDVKPSRLEKSKMEIKSFVHRLEGDRVGIVAFAGSGFLQAPLTLDYAAFFLFLDGINTGYIPDPGTSLSQAVYVALKSFPKESMKHKAIILFSDGEDNEGGLDQALQAAKDAGIRIYTIGTGTEEGEPIPLKDESGRKSGYKKDRAGQVVITKLNKANLEKIAQETGAVYLPSTPGEREVDIVLKHIQSLGQRTFKERMIAEKEDHFQLFLSFGLLFLLLEMFVRRTRSIKKGPEILGVLLLFFLFSGFLETKGTLTSDGEKRFQEKKFESALENYRKAQVKDPEDPYIQYDLGSTLYKLQQYQEAEKHLEKTIAATKDDSLKARALYNQGNTLYRLGKFEEAIESYKKALKINPNDQDAKFNLEFLQKSKNRFEKQDQDRQKESQKQQQQNQQQQQQQNQQQQQQKPQQKQDQQQQQQQQPQQQNQQNQQQQEQPQNGQEQGDQQSKQPDKGEDKDKGGQQKDEKKDQQPSEGQQGEQPEKPDQQGEQQQNAKPEQKPGDMPEQQSQQEQKPDQSPQEQNQQEQRPAAGGQQPMPLQGQMTKQDALRVLDALMDSEKEFQDLRRPPQQRQERTVEKDW